MGLQDFKFEIFTGDQCPTGSLYPHFSTCNTEPGKWLPYKSGDFLPGALKWSPFPKPSAISKKGSKRLKENLCTDSSRQRLHNYCTVAKMASLLPQMTATEPLKSGGHRTLLRE